MSVLNEKMKADLLSVFATMQKDVNISFFTQQYECNFCKETHSLLDEIVALQPKLHLKVYDLEQDSTKVHELQIDKIPAIAIDDGTERGIRFFGVPAGYEFSSFIAAIMLTSTGKLNLSVDTKAFLDYNQQPIHLQVFVSPTCPYCPGAVILAHQMAYYSKNVTADMIELTEFPHLAQKYAVQGVPRTVINEVAFTDGAVPDIVLIEKIKSIL